MIDHYTRLVRALRELARKSQEGIDAVHFDENEYTASVIGDFILREAKNLARDWPRNLDRAALDGLLAKGRPSTHEQFVEVRDRILPSLEDQVDDYFAAQPAGDLGSAILEILHPAVVQSSYAQFRQGQYRDAVFNSVVAVFDMIRARTGLDSDGTALIGDTLSLSDPRLVLSEITTESGRNDQKGFLQIFQGIFLGVRNPKAHSLSHDLDQIKAAQYLIFSSLLARRVEDASVVPAVAVSDSGE